MLMKTLWKPNCSFKKLIFKGSNIWLVKMVSRFGGELPAFNPIKILPVTADAK